MNELDRVIKERKASARFYGFEDTLWEMPGFAGLKAPLSIARLQLCAGYVWAREGGRGACPVIRPRRQNDYSYWLQGEGCGGTIHLAQNHRNLGGLLHEMAHALGTRDKLQHGPAFRKRLLRLLKFYGEWSGKVE